MIYAFVRYYVAWRKDRNKDLRYRYYVTDALRVITENTAKLGGKYMTTRFADLISEKKKEKPQQTSKEIADDIIKRLRA